MLGHRRRAGHEQETTTTQKLDNTRIREVRMTGKGVQEDILSPEFEIDEAADLIDCTDEEDDEYFESAPLGASDGKIRPVWMCAGGVIIWCNPRFGFHVQFREKFRRVLEAFIGPYGLRSLGKPFESADVDDTLPLLFGFFREVWLRSLFAGKESGEDDSDYTVDSNDEPPVESTEDDKGDSRDINLYSKMNALNNVGMLLPGGETVPLSIFWARPGERTESVPRRLEQRWIRYVFRERRLDETFKWKDVKEWLPSEYRRFVKDLRSLLERNLPGVPHEKLPADITLETLQRKKLSVFKQYLKEGV